MRRWGFLTNHGIILIHVIQHPHSTVREIALACGITERATLSILRNLRDSGIVESAREGRRNFYSINFQTLSDYRREGPARALLPDAFVGELVKELLSLSAKRSRKAPAQQPNNIAFLRPGTNGPRAPSSAASIQ